MATAAVIRARIFDYLYGSGQVVRPFAHRLNGAYTSGGTAVVDDGTKFTAGDIIEFQTDGNQARVESISANTLTIQAGLNGTTDANQLDNAVLFKNPRFTIKKVDNATTEVLEGLEGRGIFVFGTGTIVLVAAQTFYDVTATDIVDQYGVLAVYEKEATTLLPLNIPFRYYANIHTTITTSGQGLHILSFGNSKATDTLYYTYAKKIDATADLLVRQEELVVLGAAGRATAADINPRTADPGKRTDRTVQPGQAARDARWFEAEFQRACWREEALLAIEVKHALRQTRASARIQRWHW